MNDPDPDPNRLQELISSNALIASFLGPPVSENDEVRDNGGDVNGDDDDGNDVGAGKGRGREGESHKPSSSSSRSLPLDQDEINKLLHSISYSCDIDALVAGIASDLRYFVKHSLSFYYDSTNDSGRGIHVGGGVKGTQVGDNTTTTTTTTTDSDSDSDSKNKNDTDQDTIAAAATAVIGKSNTAADETESPVVRHTSGTTSTSELSNTGDDNNNNSGRPTVQVPITVPVTVPVQLQTLVYRISRLKSLLYNEAPSLLSPSENTTSNNSNNNDNTQTSSPTSFIQHFLPILSSNSNDQHEQSHDKSFTTNSNINNNKNTIVSDYQHKQNVKKILRTLLLTKSENSIRNKNINGSSKTHTNSHRFIIPMLLQYIHLLPFETRKNVSSIFNYLLVNTGTSSTSSRQEFVLYVRDYFNIVMDFIVGGHFIHGINMERGKSKNSSTIKKGGAATNAPSTTTASRSTSNNSSTSEERKNSVSAGDGGMNGNSRINDKTKAVHYDGALATNSNNREQDTNPNVQVKPTETAGAATPTNKASATTATQKRRLDSIHRSPDVALHCGSMLRSIIRHPILYAQLVNNESNVQKYIFPFLDCFVNQPNFETASDALETLRLILHPTEIDVVLPSCDDDNDDDYYNDQDYVSLSSPINSNHNTNLPISPDEIVLLNSKDPAEIEIIMEKLSSSFLERDYTPIFAHRFNPKLLSSDHANYITRRVSLQLLSSILLTRSNYSIMIKYVSSKSNLRTIMMLLRDSSAHITLEAFNVFKIFVANPNKPPEVLRILADNKVKLIKYLSGLHKEREDMDEQFRDEKVLVISTLEQMLQLE